jgi:HPt (histidine-containing phosphotransfer) domain-containing protein
MHPQESDENFHHSGSLLAGEETVLENLCGNVQLLSMLQKKFLPNVSEQLANADEALAQNDAAKLKAALHTIKGVCLSLGVKVLADRSAELEQQLKTSENVPLATILTPEVRDELSWLVKASDLELLSLAERLNSV